jgi:hypothetical protein
MTKKIIALSAIAAMATTTVASTDVDSRLDAMEKKIQKLEKKLKKTKKQLTEVKKHDGQDDIKWDVDYRTSFDSIHYTHKSGAKSSNPDLMTHRLWLGMGFSPNDNTLFKGKLSSFKAFGDSSNHSQANTNPGYADFDWITSENAQDNSIKVKEAYWFYMNDTFVGNEVPWTISIGRRPSTDGLGINLREGMKDNSPLSHTVNVEFDGMSSRFDLDKVTPLKGGWFKLCTGRGLTNAKPRFQNTGDDYAADGTQSNTNDINMYGFLFVPYDDGQYSIHTNWARAENLIGFDKAGMSDAGMVSNGMDPATKYANGAAINWLDGTTITYDAQGNPTNQPNTSASAQALNKATAASVYAPKFKNFGDMDLMTLMFKAEGLGDGINDFLDDTTFFASWAQSKTRPKGNYGTGGMLGSNESKTGTSTWLGVNMPCPMTDDGRFGVEWNKGSKYWRSVTYGEDTMAGSKIATRGTAFEMYYNKPINNALSFNLRYTSIKYAYTGSNAFFGDDGAAFDINTDSTTLQRAGLYGDPVKKATDLRASVSYRF